VVPLTQSGTYAIGPAPTAESTYVVRVQGSNPRGEYFLLENREAVLADTGMIAAHCAKSHNPPNCGGGLLIWHVDSIQVANNGFHVSNRVNAGSIHGVELEQADGLRNLEYPDGNPQSTRGDAGDPYPGITNNTLFSFKTNPAALKNSDGSFVGFAIDSIRRTGTNGPVTFRLRFGGVTQVKASDTTAFVQLDGTSYHVFEDLLDTTPPHLVSVADAQYRTDSLVRWTFQSWSDGGSRTHSITASASGGTLVATLARAFRLQVATNGTGTVTTTPPAVAGTYVAEGGPVQLVAHPSSGLIFLGWSGDTTSGDSVLSVAMQHPRAFTATFGPQLAIHDVLQQLVTGSSSLSAAQVRYVDLVGNKNDVTHVDVGDFLAWVRTVHPTPPGAPTQEGGP
jgi:Divergent InlB B-repeat domain